MTPRAARLQVALAALGVLVATLGLVALLSGCTAHGAPVGVGGRGTVTVAAGFVASSGLGYESGYPEAGVEAGGDGRLAWRAAARVAQAEKIETGDGVGYGAVVLAGARSGDFRFLAGPAWSYQSTSAYSKSSTYVRTEIDWLPRGHDLRLYGDWRAESVENLPGGQVERALGLAWRSPGRLALDAGAERVWFRSWGEPAPPGSRYHLGVAYRFGSR